MENLINQFKNLNYQEIIPYLKDTSSIYIVFIILFLILLIVFTLFSKKSFKYKKPEIERKQPNLDEIVETKNLKIGDDNEFVDVLVAIEEEMTAIRELYVGGYISKGVYISETDRLYEKAKIFGI